MYYIGIDPDLHTMPVAVIDQTNRLLHLNIYRVSDSFKEQAAILAMAKIIKNIGYMIEFGNPNTIDVDHVKAFAVEAQEIYAGVTKNPRNILHLGNVAGAALSIASAVFEKSLRYFPTPIQWKGNVPKEIHHRRILTKAGYTNIATAGSGDNTYCYPVDEKRFDLNKGDWKHACDAIGLAQWALKKSQEV